MGEEGKLDDSSLKEGDEGKKDRRGEESMKAQGL